MNSTHNIIETKQIAVRQHTLVISLVNDGRSVKLTYDAIINGECRKERKMAIRKPKTMKSERFEYCKWQSASYGQSAIWWAKDDWDKSESVKESGRLARLAARWAMRAIGERT